MKYDNLCNWNVRRFIHTFLEPLRNQGDNDNTPNRPNDPRTTQTEVNGRLLASVATCECVCVPDLNSNLTISISWQLVGGYIYIYIYHSFTRPKSLPEAGSGRLADCLHRLLSPLFSDQFWRMFCDDGEGKHANPLSSSSCVKRPHSVRMSSPFAGLVDWFHVGTCAFWKKKIILECVCYSQSQFLCNSDSLNSFYSSLL